MACRQNCQVVPIADLGLDPSLPGQAGNTVGTAGLTLIKQVVMQLAVAIDLAALLPGILNELGLAVVFLSPLAQRVLEPGIKAAGMDGEASAHGAYTELLAVLGDERVPHFSSLAQCAAAFLGCRAPR